MVERQAAGPERAEGFWWATVVHEGEAGRKWRGPAIVWVSGGKPLHYSAADSNFGAGWFEGDEEVAAWGPYLGKAPEPPSLSALVVPVYDLPVVDAPSAWGNR